MRAGDTRVVAEVTQVMSPEDVAKLAEELARPEAERDLADLLNLPPPTIDELMPRDAPLFHNPAIDSNLGLEGNWIIHWADSDEPDGYAVLSKGGAIDCVGEPCWSEFARDPAAPWEVVFWQPGGGSAGYVDMAADGLLNVYYFNFHLGTNGGRSIGRAVSSDRIEGAWTYVDQEGAESWVRVRSKIRWFQAYSEGPEDTKAIGGNPLAVRTTYIPPGNYMRGNRSSFIIDVYGDELWGRHYPWIARETGLEIWDVSYICTPADGGYVTHSDWAVCFNQGGVEGLSIEIIVWPDAAPGLQHLYIDGMPIPLELEVAGWPE